MPQVRSCCFKWRCFCTPSCLNQLEDGFLEYVLFTRFVWMFLWRLTNYIIHSRDFPLVDFFIMTNYIIQPRDFPLVDFFIIYLL